MTKELNRSSQRRLRAAGLVRALVVATSTLAILIVCFFIYQASQELPETSLAKSVQPTSRVEPETSETDMTNVPGVATGVATLGPGQKIQMTFYPKSGNRGRVELAVASWTPVEGSANEFILIEPDVRMRTDDGHAIRIQAKHGIIEAQRKSGSGLDPRRGHLSQGIVIQYDRLTEKQRAALPPERQAKIDPADLVRMEMEALDFDLEYGKLMVPGKIRITASDLEFETSSLEVRFNDAQNRVERLRINGSGRLTLLGLGENSALSLPSIESANVSQVSLVEWLRASIQSKIASKEQRNPRSATASAKTDPRPTETEDGVPIFRRSSDKDRDTKPPVQYYARFEGSVNVSQFEEEKLKSQLQADLLEIVRSLWDMDRDAAVEPTPDQGKTQTAREPKKNRVELRWTDRLFVEVCSPDDVRCNTETRSTINASGSPAKITFAQGTATCRSLSFEPDGSKVWLRGTESRPATVDMTNEGVIRGSLIYTERKGDELLVSAEGPGQLVRGSTSIADDESRDRAKIDFSDSFEARGRFVPYTRLDLASARMVTGERQVLDRAEFVGAVRMHEGDTMLEADKVALTFASANQTPQTIEHVNGIGHVTLTQGPDQIWCREIDIELGTESTGRTIPVTATASGDVVARQGTRTIRAKDRLTVDFKMFDRPLAPFDITKAQAVAIAAGKDPAKIDWEAVRRKHEQKDRREPGVRKLAAFGAVNVVDPEEGLNLTAESVDCALHDGRDITTAIIQGTPKHPASVTLDALTVIGSKIHLNVPDQHAEVPGAGRLTLMSQKDLDGRKLDKPIPIAITWTDWMRYQGRENRSVFMGTVHATSRTTTTFDCDRLQIDFEDVAQRTPTATPPIDWWVFQRIVDRVNATVERNHSKNTSRFSKQPASILATGHAVAVTSEFAPSGALLSRSSISGPKLSVNLRSEASKLIIEGPGTLLIEDLKVDSDAKKTVTRSEGGMFGVSGNAGPSTTLVEWRDLMWYDFSIDQTRFDGDVQLTYLSGNALSQIRSDLSGHADSIPSGRTTFLSCDELTVDFASQQQRSKRSRNQRMGGLSSERLEQFEARHGVVLQDDAEGLNLTADRVVFRKESCLLEIHGTQARKAHIVKNRPGQLPHQVSVKRLFYDSCTGEIEVSQPALQSP